jgi:hypothetical protein
MYELTMSDLDGHLAEQLPARELMGTTMGQGGPYGPSSGPSHSFNTSHSYNIAAAGNGNGSGNHSFFSANGNSVALSGWGNSAAGNNFAAAGN